MAFESGAAGALAGVQFGVIGAGAGRFTRRRRRRARSSPTTTTSRRRARRRREHAQPRRRRCLRAVADRRAIAAVARKLGCALHLDGARLWNARVALRRARARAGGAVRLGQRLLVEGARRAGRLGARRRPKALIDRAHRCRKMLGGGMRQAGILAAGRPVRARAPRRAAGRGPRATRAASPRRWRARPASRSTSARVETNIVIWISRPSVPDRRRRVRRARARAGVLRRTPSAARTAARGHPPRRRRQGVQRARAEIAAAVLRAA